MEVSRSRRVRKKPSKLVEFESPDEIDIRAMPRREDTLGLSTPTGSEPLKKVKEEDLGEDLVTEPFLLDMHQVIIKDEMDTTYLKEEPMSEESEDDFGSPHNEESSLDLMISDLDATEGPDLEKEGPEGFQPIAGDPEDSSSQNQSRYMLEKSNRKKLVIKDGKIVGRTKSQRKDKGKSRFTAYMLWAKEIRQEIMKSDPSLDFSQISKKLGELWSTVPYNKKYTWKRRAKRMTTQLKTASSASQMVETGQEVESPPERKLIKHSPSAPSTLQELASSPPEPMDPNQPLLSTLKMNGQSPATAPLDFAAKLRLVGESLTTAGEMLTDHRSHVRVSKTFSHLIDSLLTEIEPLLSLVKDSCSKENKT